MLTAFLLIQKERGERYEHDHDRDRGLLSSMFQVRYNLTIQLWILNCVEFDGPIFRGRQLQHVDCHQSLFFFHKTFQRKIEKNR